MGNIRNAGFILLILAALAALNVGSIFAQETMPETTPEAELQGAATDLFNTRYCEIIPVYRQGLTLISHVYNTIGLNDCPTELWSALDGETLAQELNAAQVVMNGPRFWLMDTLIGAGATAAGETMAFGDLEMTLRATIETPLRNRTVGSEPYTEQTIQRETEFIFSAEYPVFTLTSPDGAIYIMQSYTQGIDPEMTLEGLATLGERLDLPDGWAYQMLELDEDLHLIAQGTATVVNDEYANAYQRLDSAMASAP